MYNGALGAMIMSIYTNAEREKRTGEREREKEINIEIERGKKEIGHSMSFSLLS